MSQLNVVDEQNIVYNIETCVLLALNTIYLKIIV